MSKVRVIIPDSHGKHIDQPAATAFLKDLKRLDPDEIVMLGDHLDCAGTFSKHARSYADEMGETYEDDCYAANLFLDGIQKCAPKASIDYIEGNHEYRVERWAAETFVHEKDAKNLLERIGPQAALEMKSRGIRYYRRGEFYQGLAIPGTIRKGKVFFTHGISHSKHADTVHLARFGASVVFGHVHRSMSTIERTVTSTGHGAWCPGTLAKLQPLYFHTAPTSWTHGYAVQFLNKSGQFLHVNVPIHKGQSLLNDLILSKKP